MPWYPSNFTALNTSDYSVWLNGVNVLSGGWIGIGILFLVFIVSFTGLNAGVSNATPTSLAASCFLTWLISFILLSLGLISFTIFSMCFSLVLLTAFWVWAS